VVKDLRHFLGAFIVSVMIGSFFLSNAQEIPNPSVEDSLIKHINFYGESKEITGYRVNGFIKIDGILSEDVWQNPGVTGFTQQDPDEGKLATEKTVAWVAFDDEAIYVAAKMYDRDAKSIVSRLGRRDQELASDFIAFGIDSYNDKQTGFYFLVRPSGAIEDGTISNDSWFDNTWDGVWDSAAKIDSNGWTAEFRIPYSQLRFTKKEDYVWGFNVLRFIQRKQENDYLSPIPKNNSREVSLYPSLVGISNISPPRRLEFLPYAVGSASFLDYNENDPFGRARRTETKIGTDLKWGISSNFTLDGTINPDFGQVELDPAVVNLSAFETFFDEKRPFFIEGSGIFSFGYRGATSNWGFNSSQPNFFYSRRIGRSPQIEVDTDGEVDSPINTTIISAAKISGKTKHNWEVGVLSALTAREYAEVDSQGVRSQQEVEPLTTYNVARAFHNFGDNRFGLGFLGTAVVRDLRTEEQKNTLRDNAFTGGIDGYTFIGAKKTWALNGWIGASHLTGSKQAIVELQESSQHYYQRPDFKYVRLDSNRTILNGWAGRIALNKEKGNFYLNTAIGVNSPGFETNDLGFHWRSNIINSHFVLGYMWFQPGRYFRNARIFAATFRNYDFDGNKTWDGVMGFVHGQFHNYWWFDGEIGFAPRVLDNTRTRGGPLMLNPRAFWFGFLGATDDRKPIVFNLGGNYSASDAGGYDFQIQGKILWKPSSGMEISLEPKFYRNHAIAQWIDNIDDPTATFTYGKRHLFALMDQQEFSSSVRFNYTFTPKLSFELYMQPLISSGIFQDFKEFAEPGTFNFNHYGQGNSQIDYDEVNNQYEIDPDGSGQNNFRIDNPDFNFRSLRGTTVLRWEYAPGSILYFVWTHERSGDELLGEFNFRRDMNELSDLRANNIFLVKISYWVNP
jgi:hypothetical protein